MSANDLPVNFSYAKWPPSTTFKLCNVTWDMGYRDIVRFVDEKAQQDYFDSLDGLEFKGCTMAKYGLPVRVPVPFAQASKYNYLVATNEYDFDTPRSWYYFIQTVDYVNAQTTQLNIQLDVWQSFQFNITLGNAYVERGHVGVANENQWADYGREYLDLPEGLDTGKTTVIAGEQYKSLIPVSENGTQYDFGVIVVSTTQLEADPGTESAPKTTTADGGAFESHLNGTAVYYLTVATDLGALLAAGADYPWVTQGICGIYAVPPLPARLLEKQESVNTAFKTGVDWHGKCYRMRVRTGKSDSRYTDIITIKNFRDNFKLPDRYKYLKKFRTAPYAYVECSCLNGDVITYEPEQVPSNDLVIRESWDYAPPSPRLNFYARGYHASALSQRSPLANDLGLPIDSGEMLNAAFGMTNFPTFMAVNNGSALSLANSAYTRAYARKSADWTQQKTQMGINNAYRAAEVGTSYASAANRLATSNRNAMNSISNTSAQMGSDLTLKNLSFSNSMSQLNTIGSGAANALGNLAGGNVGGSVGAVAGAAIGAWVNEQTYQNNVDTANTQLANQTATNNATTSQANAYALASTNLSNSQTMQLADMNRALAQATAKGDYENTIAGINAQVQQTQTVAPTTSGALGGDSFNLANGLIGVLVRFRQITPAAMRSIGEVWLRYGYYVQRFMTLPKSLMAMNNFTYWKVHELYVRSSTCPEEYRLTIKGIFESGVTVWTDPSKIGVTDYADNAPLDGIVY